MDCRLYLLKRFPYLEKAISDKLDTSEDFRTLCQDYFDTAEALSMWEDSTDPDPRTKGRISEYRSLMKNLEEDILLEIYRSTRS
jgi:DNA phosphorothioation-dependent restriction protein DptG